MSLRDCPDVSGMTLFDADLMAVLGLRTTAFYARKKSGLFDRFKVIPQFGGRTQYSGRLVQEWRDAKNATTKADTGTLAGRSPVALRLLAHARSR